MTEHKMMNLFPTPVMVSEIGRNFTEKEMAFILEKSKDPVQNHYNYSSKDVHVLNKPEMKDIKKFILTEVKRFIEITENPKYQHEYYITNSWFNFTNPGQAHHRHRHQNGLVTGVLYINANEQYDTINFINDIVKIIEIENKGWNHYNSRLWTFSVKSGQLFLFRSDLPHEVPHTSMEAKHTRISLAFNTFIRGDIGSPELYTELHLK